MFLFPWLLGCLTLVASPGANAERKSTIPEYLSEWIKLSPPKYNSTAWSAAGWSEYEWEVEMKNGRPVAHRRDPKAEPTSALPTALKRAAGERGEVRAVQVSNGWLVDYNAGEWGGSLWWYAPDGKQRYKISNDQLQKFLPTSKGLFALEGLAHLSYNAGQVVHLQQDAAGKWTSARFVKLEHEPEAGLVDGEGNLLVCTTDELVLIHADKTQKVLFSKAFWRGLYPNSIALGPTGDVYVGMRHGVSRIHLVNGTYAVDWLLPNQDFVHAKPRF